MGDNSGHSKKSSAGVVGGELATDFSILEDYLMVKADRATEKQNELHVRSRSVINQLFWSYPVFINKSRCQALISDLETGQVNNRGGVLKDDDANRQDAGDAFRYLVHAEFPEGKPSIRKYLSLLLNAA